MQVNKWKEATSRLIIMRLFSTSKKRNFTKTIKKTTVIYKFTQTVYQSNLRCLKENLIHKSSGLRWLTLWGKTQSYWCKCYQMKLKMKVKHLKILVIITRVKIKQCNRLKKPRDGQNFKICLRTFCKKEIYLMQLIKNKTIEYRHHLKIPQLKRGN